MGLAPRYPPAIARDRQVLGGADMKASQNLFWCLLVIKGLAQIAHAQPATVLREDFWVPDGVVHTVVATNGVVYVGGDFKTVCPNAGRGEVLNIFSAESRPLLPQANGGIFAVVADGSGGWFIAGDFTAVGGIARTNLAHVRADMTVDPVFRPNPDGILTNDLAHHGLFALLRNENVLYVGGVFTNIAGVSRSGLAAVDTSTGALLPWNGNVDGEVYALALQNDRLIVGGTFSAVGGAARTNLAAVDALTGTVLSWNPSVTASNAVTGSTLASVNAFAISGDTLFVAGDYDHVNGTPRNHIAAVDVNSGALKPWDPSPDGSVQALGLYCNPVYRGGRFRNIAGVARNFLAALDAQTAQPTAWNPGADDVIYALTVVGNTVFAGGWFNTVGGLPRNSLAAIDLLSGKVTPWVARADRLVLALAVSGNDLFAGGGGSAGGVARKNLAAFDEQTGQPLDWNPATDGPVYTLAVSSNAVYVGGRFSTLAGQTRVNLGAINRATGEALTWQADATLSIFGYVPGVFA